MLLHSLIADAGLKDYFEKFQTLKVKLFYFRT